MATLAKELPLAYCILNALGYTIFCLSVAAVLCGLMFLLFHLIDKRRT